MKIRLLGFAIVAIVAVTGCSKSSDKASSAAVTSSATASSSTSSSSPSSSSPAALPINTKKSSSASAVSPASASTSRSVSAVPPVNTARAGEIKGTVKLDGLPPIFPRIFMIAWPSCSAMHHGNLYPPVVITGKHGELANVVVWVKSGLTHRRYAAPAKPVILDQNGCMYDPRVVALMTDQPLWVENHDQTEHEVHVVAKHNPQWSTTQPAGSPPYKVSFKNPETAIPILCKVHPWMRAYAFVFNNPYFAVTSKNGTFDLKNLPPGTYTIETWQENYGVQDRRVTLAPHATKTISFVYHAKSSKG